MIHCCWISFVGCRAKLISRGTDECKPFLPALLMIPDTNELTGTFSEKPKTLSRRQLNWPDNNKTTKCDE